jgi:hypothetical protein
VDWRTSPTGHQSLAFAAYFWIVELARQCTTVKRTQVMIPDDVAQFITRHIDSIAQLEALLLLRREPCDAWTVLTLAQRLYISERQTLDALERLCASGLVIAAATTPSAYRYQPASPDLGVLVDLTAQVYSKHLVPVTNLIHSKPKTRVQEFADAFKIRKDDK